MKFYFLLFFSCFFLMYCQEKENQSKKNTQKQTDFTPAFKIQKYEHYQLLTIYFNEKKDSVLYAFVPKNKKIETNIPTKNIIRTPVQKIVTFSHTHLACIEKLEQNNTILGVTEGSFLKDSKWEKSIQEKKIIDLGTADEGVKEKIIAIKPEIVLISNAMDINKLSSLRKFNIQTIVNLDWLETHPLGRAEWIKIFGLMFETEKEAENIFEKIQKEYNEIKNIAQKKSKNISVLTDMPFRGTWYLAGGKSYMAQFIKDAGGDFVGKDNDNTASIPMTIEKLYVKGKNIDIWLNVGQAKTLDEIAKNDERLTNFLPYQQKKIYNYGADYWLTSIINPQEILADMLHIFHPELLKDRKMKYYTKLK
ncbi:MAG: ABC transporter substrate-binding protein [Bacteroidetes bacterium]|nr:MAG: ABC transporter substrate-binding protein [Bacteroidota bacterium]TAG88609.1 MAG: ABC transporter substrate-binding protein [Bacteroidota bacterium]